MAAADSFAGDCVGRGDILFNRPAAAWFDRPDQTVCQAATKRVGAVGRAGDRRSSAVIAKFFRDGAQSRTSLGIYSQLRHPRLPRIQNAAGGDPQGPSSCSKNTLVTCQRSKACALCAQHCPGHRAAKAAGGPLVRDGARLMLWNPLPANAKLRRWLSSYANVTKIKVCRAVFRPGETLAQAKVSCGQIHRNRLEQSM